MNLYKSLTIIIVHLYESIQILNHHLFIFMNLCKSLTIIIVHLYESIQYVNLYCYHSTLSWSMYHRISPCQTL